jgi:L-asparaginase / beta-aspartyl-peptidase
MIFLCNGEGAPGVATTVAALKRGEAALDAIEAGIRRVEADPTVRSVGPGSWPNILGQLQLDAAVMDGGTLRTGAVGALEGFAHPLGVARAVLAQLPHEILVGAGAARFAAEIGAERTGGNPEEVEQAWRGVLEREGTTAEAMAADPTLPLASLVQAATDPERVRDTTVYLAQDRSGNVCTGVSTSGWAWKYPGRLGDSPIIGAGSYADRRYGAAACTHTGEMTIRAGTARAVVLYLKMGLTLDDALAEAGRDLASLGGGQQGTVVIHAADAQGHHRVAAYKPEGPLHYWLWTPDMPGPERREVSVL